jgi:hypothetical protein
MSNASRDGVGIGERIGQTMSKEKQIEEITKILDSNCEGIPYTVCQENSCSSCKAKQIIGVGYRKQSVGEWISPTTIGGRAFSIPHCSACNGIPCGVDENTKFCPNCGAKMKGV